MTFTSIALFCGSSAGNHPKYAGYAAEIGQYCAQHGLTLYYGGASIGLMVAAANAARQHGGKVVGIAPSFFSAGTVLDTSLNENLIFVNSMSERKQLLEKSADAFVILPGSYGTMDEFFEVLTDAQLGIHAKPIVILNVDGYYNPLIEQLNIFNEEGFLRNFHKDLVLIADNVSDLFIKLQSYENTNSRSWLDKIKKRD